MIIYNRNRTYRLVYAHAHKLNRSSLPRVSLQRDECVLCASHTGNCKPCKLFCCLFGPYFLN